MLRASVSAYVGDGLGQWVSEISEAVSLGSVDPAQGCNRRDDATAIHRNRNLSTTKKIEIQDGQ